MNCDVINDRKIFKVDVGDLTKEDAELLVRLIKENFLFERLEDIENFIKK